MSEDAGPPRLLLVALVAVALLIVAVALVAVLTRGAPDALDPESPEGVVQRYAQAVIDDDPPAARELLDPDTFQDCERVVPAGGDLRVTFVETVEREKSALVRVLVRMSLGVGVLGEDLYESEETFALVRVAGAWRIESAPWPLAVCDEGGRP